MKDSDDVTKLMALFDGGKSEKHYQEVRQVDQSKEARERWPLLKQMPVAFNRPVVHSAARETSELPSVNEEVVASVPTKFGTWHPAAAIDDTPPAPASDETCGALGTLFSRLINPQEATLPKPESIVPVEPDSKPLTLHSLFDRLRLP